MANSIAFFAIQADDLDRARRFYERVFGWKFNAWGPPDFWLIDSGDPNGIAGALERRVEPLTGTGNRTFECTIAVDSVDAIAKAVSEAGGTIVMPKVQIPTVGWLIKFLDTESNLVGAMKYETGRPPRP